MNPCNQTNVTLNEKEINLILGALDYQDAEFGTYDSESSQHLNLKVKLEKLVNEDFRA